MGNLEKRFRDDERSKRADDPHAWAERVDRELEAKLWLPGITFFVVLGLCVLNWLMWKERDRIITRLENIENFVVTLPEFEE